MTRSRWAAAVMATTFCFAKPVLPQGDHVYIHGGNAESLVSGCAAVGRMDIERNTAPMKDVKGLSYCFGYLSGAVDMTGTLDVVLPSPKDKPYCVPDSASVPQLAKIVVKYGNEHPEELHQPALILLTKALARAFPC